MRKPMTEHSTTFKPRKGGEAQAPPPARKPSMLEPVTGGHVRRVEFEVNDTEPAPRFETRTVREPAPKRDDSMDDIHFEVDNLHRIRRGAPPRARAPREPVRTRRVFDTDGGSVKEAHQETETGERRVLYTSSRRTGKVEETRFHSGLVDRILAERYEGGPKWEDTDEKKGRFGRKKTTSSEVVEAEVVKRGRGKTARKAGKAKRVKDAKEAKETAEEPDYQPQCGAVTRDGLQCRNSTKDSSDYCGAHQSYNPRSLDDLLDTKPARGDDTKPGVGDASGTGQCAAHTKSSLQCRNNSRSGSKYCGAHRNYRAPSKSELSKAIDTTPRHAKARDTVPKVK